jgi:hypothetical protein
MKNKKYHTVATVTKSNNNNKKNRRNRCKIDSPTMHSEPSTSWLDAGTVYK